MSHSEPSLQKPLIAGKKIIIVGCGIAGLAFPLALRKQWPDKHIDEFPTITIYERDSRAIQPGREGYSISIRGDNVAGGIQVLHRIDLLEKSLSESITGKSEGENKGSFTCGISIGILCSAFPVCLLTKNYQHLQCAFEETPCGRS